MTIKNISVEAASEALKILENLTQEFFIFRGHRDPAWRLQSTLARHRVGPPDRRTTWEIDDMIDHFIVQLKSIGIPIPFREKDRRARLEFARHYGVPSPLIDFSFSPYVALFFAFNGVRPLQASNDDYVAIYCLNIHHLGCIWAKQNSMGSDGKVSDYFTGYYNDFVYHSSSDPFPNGYESGMLKYLDLPASWNHRMQRQRGVFIYDTIDYNSCGCRDFEDYLDLDEVPHPDMNHKEALIRVLIPQKVGKEIFERLELMGISATHLFGNAEGAASDVINAYNYGRKSGRAWDVKMR